MKIHLREIISLKKYSFGIISLFILFFGTMGVIMAVDPWTPQNMNQGNANSPIDQGLMRGILGNINYLKAEIDSGLATKIGNRIFGTANPGVDNFWIGLKGTSLDGQRVAIGISSSDATGGNVNGIKFRTSNADRMAIDSTGNVGIGTSTPGAKLEINAGSLGAGLGNELLLTRLKSSNSNINYLDILQKRHTVGSDWLSASTRIQQTTDVTKQGYIEFNPINGAYGIALGSRSSEYIRIADGGNVGIGITTPWTKLDVNGWTSTRGITTIDNAYPSIHFYSPTQAPTHGQANIHYAQESGGATNDLRFGRYDSAGTWKKNPVRFDLDAPDSTLVLTEAGNIGIGTSGPGARLHVVGTTIIGSTSSDYNPDGGDWNYTLRLDGSDNTSIGFHDSGSNIGSIRFKNNNFYIGSNDGWGVANTTFGGNVYAAGYGYASDKNLKKDIQPLKNSLEKILALNGYSYAWKSNGKKDIGVIAQEVEKVFPEIVHTNEDTKLKSVEYGNLVAPLIESIKTQQESIQSQQKEIEFLKKELTELKKKMK